MNQPEYRQCPATHRWVIIAPERAARPVQLQHLVVHHRQEQICSEVDCPLCEGMEHDTPNEVYALRNSGSRPNGPGWQLRVVPNKFPAVRPVVGSAGYGLHELVIETNRHVTNPTDLTIDEQTAVLWAYRQRMQAYRSDPQLQYATVFKNVGAEAGASLAHVHSQIITTALVPMEIANELQVTKKSFDKNGTCLYCELMEQKRSVSTRIVLESASFVVLCPYAPRQAYECWVLPKWHASHYESISQEQCRELAGVLQQLFRGLDSVLHEPAYNWFLHTAPLQTEESVSFHWHIEVTPRTARAAGFELATGVYINPVPPEVGAIQLRRAIKPTA
jgi:UDPglucose--hexose-1-phosphate uridylyltransferase